MPNQPVILKPESLPIIDRDERFLDFLVDISFELLLAEVESEQAAKQSNEQVTNNPTI
jgi:hypothetical protein